jgi:hypothetical protein
LQVTPYLLEQLREKRSQAEVDEEVEKFKEHIRGVRKQYAKRYHPDANPSADPNIMKSINSACDFLLNLKIEWMPPRPQPIVVSFSFGVNGASTTTNSTYSGYGGFYYSYQG